MWDERIRPRGWPADSDGRRSRKALLWHTEWTERLEMRKSFPENLDPNLAAALEFAPKARELQWLDPETKEPLTVANTFERHRGAFLAAAIGDAYGAAVNAGAAHRFPWRPIIMLEEDLLIEFVPHNVLLPTAVTQLTAFGLEAIIRAQLASRLQGEDRQPLAEVQHAYQRWLYTQVVGWGQQGRWPECGGPFAAQTAEPDGWLVGDRRLYTRHLPNPGVLETLTNYARTGAPSTLQNPVGRARGGDVLPRAGLGELWAEQPREAFSIGAGLAALTHGHPDDYLAGGVVAQILRLKVKAVPFTMCVGVGLQELERWPGHERTMALVKRAMELIESEYTPMRTAQLRDELGDGSDGASALAISVYVALASDYVREAILLAMNYSPHRSVVGAVSGMFLGAELGVQGVPRSLRAPLQLGEVLDTLFDDFEREVNPEPPRDDEWMRRYPGW
ncbi:ADP-ribosylglycohydrolase family protein [Saccharopolyspora terrae]|uniref:ADP-ribosylglycohydrolase family protein n=2 Tax=Saccharopolyspora terrae TaxID=2530384 RepID=A0A4R4VMH9_9PSEU|nr:ADP-ribosylglycohydrolase family protein [Saccharopolyspora terrae]